MFMKLPNNKKASIRGSRSSGLRNNEYWNQNIFSMKKNKSRKGILLLLFEKRMFSTKDFYSRLKLKLWNTLTLKNNFVCINNPLITIYDFDE